MISPDCIPLFEVLLLSQSNFKMFLNWIIFIHKLFLILLRIKYVSFADSSSSRSPRSSDGNQDEMSSMMSSPTSYPKSALTIRKLRLENERLQAELTRLRRLVVSGATSVLADKKTPTESSADPTGKIHSLEMELQLAKEALLSKWNNK